MWGSPLRYKTHTTKCITLCILCVFNTYIYTPFFYPSIPLLLRAGLRFYHIVLMCKKKFFFLQTVNIKKLIKFIYIEKKLNYL